MEKEKRKHLQFHLDLKKKLIQAQFHHLEKKSFSVEKKKNL